MKTTNGNVKLNNCKYCGGTAVLDSYNDYTTNKKYAYIKCEGCGVRTSEVCTSVISDFKENMTGPVLVENPVDSIVKIWNGGINTTIEKRNKVDILSDVINYYIKSCIKVIGRVIKWIKKNFIKC